MAGLYEQHFRMFALYNRWANRTLYAAAAKLPAEALAQDRGAFFSSVLGIFNHLLVADRIWLGRLEGNSPIGYKLDEILFSTLATLTMAREDEDARLIALIFALEEPEFAEDVNYLTNAAPQTQKRHHILSHLFNHQTHHRGQAHDLMCQLGGQDAVPVLDLLAYQRHFFSADAP
jgi:uncharacterized damage-inducible protein DinB